MNEQFHDAPSDPEDWLRAEAHGDSDLYDLLCAKEYVGQQYSTGEIEATEKREAFAYLDQHIAKRRSQLGLDPSTE